MTFIGLFYSPTALRVDRLGTAEEGHVGNGKEEGLRPLGADWSRTMSA